MIIKFKNQLFNTNHVAEISHDKYEAEKIYFFSAHNDNYINLSFSSSKVAKEKFELLCQAIQSDKPFVDLSEC